MHAHIFTLCFKLLQLLIDTILCVVWPEAGDILFACASFNLSFQHLLYAHIIKGVALCILAPKLVIYFYYILLCVRLSVIIIRKKTVSEMFCFNLNLR